MSTFFCILDRNDFPHNEEVLAIQNVTILGVTMILPATQLALRVPTN
ncbi:MAG: hypothetical protein IJU76_03790 [Desulfovibrionaceae bacterium]|nr:hypothetical protein [Desulfovibrionaceae bacterium]